jgi:hypothetical protein
MRIVKAAVSTALAAVAVLGGAGTAVADVGATSAYPRVWAWHDVNERSCASTACDVVGRLAAGQGSIAYCHVVGEPITDFGITNDIWVLVSREDGGTKFVSAVYLQGDRYANLPPSEVCTY